MAAIEQIEIKGFKAFPEKFNLELGGKHLLLYGENGSGKSSIYWALHCLFNSLRKPDSGKKYFDKNHPQNLLNRNFTPTNEGDLPYVVVNWRDQDEGRNPFISTVSIEGCRTEDRLKELSTCFINHQFLFSFFNFTNSNTVNVFPIFQKEILPYLFDNEIGLYLSRMYEQMIEAASKLSNKSSSVALKNSIDYFNAKLTTVVEEVNLRVSDIYNDKFKQEDDKVLEIKLSYPSVNPNPDLYLNGFQLKWDYPLIINNEGTAIKAPNKSLNEPIIQIEIKEDRVSIEKPQAYFNEAKLTAIALSVRFSLLDMIAPQKGSFLALDDMLISLDMCNRTKVVDFLLSITPKYNIYLFTHDRAFFELTKDKIKYSLVTKVDNWFFKELYITDNVLKNPRILDSETSYTRALNHYANFDYPASANYLRKSVEELISMKYFPSYLAKKENGETHDKLRAKLDAVLDFKLRLDGKVNNINEIKSALNTLLNPLSHRSIDTNIYRSEFKKVIDTLPLLQAEFEQLDIREEIATNNTVCFKIDENDTTSCEIRILITEGLYSYADDKGNRCLSVTKGESKTSITIKEKVRVNEKKHEFNKGTLEEICIQMHTKVGKEYCDNFLDFFYCEDGVLLKDKLLI